MKLLVTLSLIAALMSPAAPLVAAEGPTTVVVQVSPGTTAEDLPTASERVFDDWYRITGPEALAVDVKDPRFLVVQPDYQHRLIDGSSTGASLDVFGAFGIPNDPLYDEQWHVPLVGGDIASDFADGDGVVVAVIDTGLSTDNSQDLGCIDFFEPYNAISDTEGVAAVGDTDGHGTAVTAVIAECTNNNKGVASLSPGATIMPVKVLDDFGQSTSSVVAAGIDWATDNGADIINLSLGNPLCPWPCDDPVLNAAIDAAVTAGVLIIAASGNDGGSVAYPANHPDVVGVGAVGADGLITSYSSRGPDIDLVAPGGDLAQDLNSDGDPDGILVESFDSFGWDYFYWDGTSFAAPIVTAVAAMVMELSPEAPAAAVRAALEVTAIDKGAAGFDNTYGHGLVNAGEAVSLGLVERLSGLDRYSTAVAISASEFSPGVPVAYVATGLDFPDALSAVPVAGAAGGPILLVPGTTIPGSVVSELNRLNPDSIVVLGGTAVVSSQVETQLAAYTNGSVTRIAGADRFATAAALSSSNFSSADTVYIATGLSFPDALAGGPLGAVKGGPILLVGASVPSATRNELARLDPSKVVILGGTGVVSTSVEAELAAYGTVSRIAGSDRYTTALAAAQAAFPGGPSTVFVATGFDYPDALAGGPAAAAAGAPIVLVQGSTIPGSVASYLAAATLDRIVILGGVAAVSPGVAVQLQGYLD